jgi:sugar O-acyltransferase (sialic acid O-acetyltransferase NeuD family)
MKRYAIIGAGGCGRGVMPLVRQQLKLDLITGVADLVFVDNQPPAPILNGHRVLTYAQWLAEPASHRLACIAIANGQTRQRIAMQCKDHDVAVFEARANNVVQMDEVTVGEGAVLSPFVILTSNIRIGRHFHANLYSYVEHDCVIGDFVTFAPGVKCNGNVVIEDHAYIGAGAIIKQGQPSKPLVIGRGAVIGMGAVVTKSVPAGVTVVGNPARIMT